MPLERARRSLTRLRAIAAGPLRAPGRESGLDRTTALDLFTSQLDARLVDIESHELRARNEGFYTIASAGHEGNVALGALTRAEDPALLHYRSAAFFLARARAVSGDPDAGVLELLLSLAASSDDPISAGRHKVFGSVAWGIPPQTSTIASHLPKAVGMAVAIGRRTKLGFAGAEGSLAVDRSSVVLCSFGDASLNHSTAQGALNAASWVAFQRVPCPVLFVCEDNGIGVSVRTPEGWIEARMRSMPGMTYLSAEGGSLDYVYDASKRAIEICRERRAPVFLHLPCARVWAHAGSDADGEYRSREELARAEDDDPVLVSARTLRDLGVDVATLIETRLALVKRLSEEAVRRPKLGTRAAVMESIAPSRPALVAKEARRNDVETDGKPKTLAHAIRGALGDLMRKYPEMAIFGEDVAEKGGVYGVTVGLWKKFGAARVFNTLLDEQTILGMAIGAGQVGFLPFPEIQFLAYLHNAEDQLRGEAATLSFFSSGKHKNPMVIRVAGLGYQKGFGGHFHNDDSLAVLRDLPGVIVGVPSRADDAVKMLRTLAAHARIDGRVCVFVEPIALYHAKDIAHPMPPGDQAIDLGEVGVHGTGRAPVTILTYGNGVSMSLRAAPDARVIDLRWIAPLPLEALRREIAAAEAVLVVDECRVSGNAGEALGTLIAEEFPGKRFARVASADSFIPLADAANLVLLQEDEIREAFTKLVPAR